MRHPHLLLLAHAPLVFALPAGPTVSRRHVATTALAATTLQPISRAAAWCGEAVPSWAFYLKWDENPAVPFEYDGVKGTTFCRVVGDVARESKAGVPPVLVVGNPGIGYDCEPQHRPSHALSLHAMPTPTHHAATDMENFEALSVSDRRVIEANLAGTAGAVPAALLTVDSGAAQLISLCKALDVPTAHVIAHGLGALPALRLLEREPRLVRSLTLISPYGSIDDLRPEYAAVMRGQKAKTLLASGALMPTVSGNARGTCIAEARQASSGPLLDATLAAGTSLGREKLGSRLGSCTETGVRFLLASGGPTDIVDPSWDALPDTVTRLKLPRYGHLSFVEQRDDFLLALADFLDGVDGKPTNRELKFADPLTTLKELTSANPLAL